MSNLHLVDNNQSLPAGMIDTSVEFFLHSEEVHCQTQGKTFAFDDFPTRVVDIMSEDMAQNPKAVACLIDWGFEDIATQLRQYIACRHGGHDNNADICVDGKVQPSEYVACGRRGTCPYEGKLCTSIVLKNGTLSKSEILVLIDVAEGLLDKEIADKRNISIHTVRHHKDSICSKGGLERKPMMVKLAVQLGLV